MLAEAEWLLCYKKSAYPEGFDAHICIARTFTLEFIMKNRYHLSYMQRVFYDLFKYFTNEPQPNHHRYKRQQIHTHTD